MNNYQTPLCEELSVFHEGTVLTASSQKFDGSTNETIDFDSFTDYII